MPEKEKLCDSGNAPTSDIHGCMDDKELVTWFTGYTYQYRFVEDL